MAVSSLLSSDLSEPSADDMDRLVARQADHAPTVRQTNAKERTAKLNRLRDAILDRRADFQEAVHNDLRKAPVETALTEVKTTVDEIQNAVDHLSDWMAPRPVGTPLLYTGTRSEIRYEPKGVVLIMAPWNYPVNLTLGPLASALAAGNCAVLKPSEHAPQTASVLQDLIGDLYADREVAVVTGGPDVAETLTRQPFDHIYFTGSPTIGRRVMKAAAEHLASVTLELGGKSPALVDATAPLDRAAERIAWSKFVNAGQTCIAPDYVLAEASVEDELVERLRDTVHRFYGPSPATQQASDDYARLAYDDHFDAVVDLLTDALESGGRVAFGGQHDAETRFVAPTVLTDVPLDASIMQEEIFGPLLPVISYETLDDALRIVNDRPPPLSFYVFTERTATEAAVLGRTTAGSTCINEGFIHFNHPELPFGGKGESGIGRGHGRRGFEAFSNERAVLRRSYATSLLRPLFPPYGPLAKAIVDKLLRYL